MIRLSISAVLFLLALSSSAAEKNTFEGVIHATVTRAGTEPNHLIFTRKGDRLRIENTTNTLEAIRIVDLEAKKITVVFPHNTTFVQIDLTKRPAQSNLPDGPAGMQLPPAISQPGVYAPGSVSETEPNLASLPSPPAGAAPRPLPSIPGSPIPGTGVHPGENMPVSPSGIPQMPLDVGPGAGVGSMMAHMGGAVGFPRGLVGASELKKTAKTKKIQGFDCTLYTITARAETFEIWATNDSPLFPFQLIDRDYSTGRFGSEMLPETWPKAFHDRALFPLEARLKINPSGPERFSFKVDKIEKKRIEDPKLFQPPENYIKIETPES